MEYYDTIKWKSSFGSFEAPSQDTKIGTTKESIKFQKNVYFTQKERKNHTHVIGSTGTGKSKFLEYLIRQDLQNRNCGLCLIDPHGSLYEEILLYLSHKKPRLADRVILFNPAEETENILGFNPIPKVENNADYVLEMLIASCLKVWGQDNTNETPRITRWLENIFYALMVNEMTLLEASVLISTTKASQNSRHFFYGNIDYSPIREDWDSYETTSLRERERIIEGAGNRLRKFLRSEIIRNLIGVKSKGIDLLSIMEEGKILLVNLNGRNRLSPETTNFLGVMLINEIFRNSKLRDPLNRKAKPFYCYVDEFGQFITRDIARALEECRKFSLFMILAHQHLEQLKNDDEYLYSSVMTNCKNKVVFGGLSSEEVKIMTDELATGFVDLKKIKDEIYTTKTRQREETRRIIGETFSTTSGESESKSAGTTKSQSTGTGESIGESRGTSKTAGESKSHGTGETTGRGESRTEEESETTGKSESTGRSATTGSSETKGRSETTGESETRGFSKGRTEGMTESTGFSRGRNQSHTRGDSQGSSYSYSKSSGSPYNVKGRSSGSNRTENRTTGENYSENQSRGRSETTSETENFSSSKSQSFSESASSSENQSNTESSQSGTQHSIGKNTSQTNSENQSTSKNESQTESHSNSHTESQSTSISKNESETQGTSETQTTGKNQSESKGGSITITPFWVPEEYQELSNRTFWTKDELLYMEMAKIKNQGTGEAFIKIENKTPIRTKIDFVNPVIFNQRTSPKKILDFKKRVFLEHSKYYSTHEEVILEIGDRQRRFFGEELSFKPVCEPKEQIKISTPDIEPEDAYFNE